jgi:hypothetical protein
VFTRIAVALPLVALPAVAVAQTPGATLPFIAVDAMVGGISHPMRSGPTFYDKGGFAVARMAVAVRLGSRASFRPVAVLDYAGGWGRGDAVTICAPAPNATCMQRFPDVSGVALGLGLRSALGTVITVGVTGGVGRYKLGDPVRESTTGFHADAEVALRFLKHAGVVVNLRHVEIEKVKGARMWYRPVTVGFRIQ